MSNLGWVLGRRRVRTRVQSKADSTPWEAISRFPSLGPATLRGSGDGALPVTFCSLLGEEGLRFFVTALGLSLRQEGLVVTIGDLASCDQVLGQWWGWGLGAGAGWGRKCRCQAGGADVRQELDRPLRW